MAKKAAAVKKVKSDENFDRMNRMVVCPHCGAKVSDEQRICPHCKHEMKKPVYKRAWVLVLALVLFCGSMSSPRAEATVDGLICGGSKTIIPPVSESEYMDYEVNDLQKDFALDGTGRFKDRYISLTGEYSMIDSRIEYFTVRAEGEKLPFRGIKCKLHTTADQEAIRDIPLGEKINVKAKAAPAENGIGYQLNVISVEEV